MQRFCVVLPLMSYPAEKVDDRLTLRRRKVRVHHSPDGRADGVRVLSRGVGEGVAQVVRYACQSVLGRTRYALGVGANESTLRVLNIAKLDIVLQSVNELDIADTSRRPCDLPRHSFVSFLTGAARPFD